MKLIIGCAAVVGSLLFGAPRAGATSFSFTGQQRFVSLEDVARGISEYDAASDFSDYDASVGGDAATQSSSLQPTRIVASAAHDVLARTAAQSGDVAEYFVAESSFATDFTLDAAAPYTLDAALAVLGYVTDVGEFFPWFDNQLALEASLVGPGGPVFDLSFDLRADCYFQQDCSFQLPFAQSGVLDPGSYTLTVRSFAIAESDIVCFGSGCSNPIRYASASDGSAYVDLRIVPEPGTTVMIAWGLALLAGLGRRRARLASGTTAQGA